MDEVNYTQGMTTVWSDGEKIKITNESGLRHVQQNVDDLFGKGECEKIRAVMYMETDHSINRKFKANGYECISGYIPQVVLDDLADDLPKDVEKDSKLEALKDL
jgi:hypothetical protein